MWIIQSLVLKAFQGWMNSTIPRQWLVAMREQQQLLLPYLFQCHVFLPLSDCYSISPCYPYYTFYGCYDLLCVAGRSYTKSTLTLLFSVAWSAEMHPMHFCAVAAMLLLEISLEFLGISSAVAQPPCQMQEILLYYIFYCCMDGHKTSLFHFFTYSIIFNQWRQNQEVWTCSWVIWQKSCEHCLKSHF